MGEARRSCGGVEDIDSWAANMCCFLFFSFFFIEYDID